LSCRTVRLQAPPGADKTLDGQINSVGVEVFDLSAGAIGGAQDQGGVKPSPGQRRQTLGEGSRRLHLIVEVGQLIVERGTGTIIPVQGRDSSHPAAAGKGRSSGDPSPRLAIGMSGR